MLFHRPLILKLNTIYKQTYTPLKKKKKPCFGQAQWLTLYFFREIGWQGFQNELKNQILCPFHLARTPFPKKGLRKDEIIYITSERTFLKDNKTYRKVFWIQENTTSSKKRFTLYSLGTINNMENPTQVTWGHTSTIKVAAWRWSVKINTNLLTP